MSRHLVAASALTAFAALVAADAMAGTTGALLGRVEDPKGAPVTGARVLASSVALQGGTRSTMTDERGFYSFLALPPGTYEIEVIDARFPDIRREGAAVHVDSTAKLDLTLGLDTMDVEVEVRGRGRVDPRSTEVTTSLDQDVIGNLPVIGRSYTAVLSLAPGVLNANNETTVAYVHGARADANQWYFDGSNVGARVHLNMDAIERMEIETAAYRAELGRSDGAITNVLLKSGGNRFAGTFRFDFRDDALDARGSGKPDLSGLDFYRRYYAATLGGPIVRDRFWFFASAFLIDEVDLYHLDGAYYEYQERPSTLENLQLKLTYQISDSHQLVLSYLRDPLVRHNSDYGFGNRVPSARAMEEEEANWYQLRETAVISPTILLESMISIVDDKETRIGPDADAPPPDSPWSGLDEDTGLIVGRYTDHVRLNSDRSQLREDLTIYVDDAMGSHDLKMGIDYQLESMTGTYRKDDYYFLRGGVPYRKRYLPDDPRINPSASSHSRSFALYVQDAWSPRAGVTLNLGLRADYQQIPFNGLTGQDVILTDPTFGPYDRQAEIGRIDALGVAPRLGIAWDPGRDGRSVLRASASRFFTNIPGIVASERGAAFSGNFQCATDAAGACLSTSDPDVDGVTYVDRDIKMPHTDELTLGYERALSDDIVLGATLMVRRGRGLLQDVEINTAYSDRDGDGLPEHESFINPSFQEVYIYRNHDRLDYHGLEVAFRKELARSWQLLASYTYSAAKGDAPATASTSADDPRTAAAEYGYLDYDQRHALKVDATYVLPWQVLATASARYYSGLPYSILEANYFDANENGFYDVGERAGNDVHYRGDKNGHRNPDYLNVNLRFEKDVRIKGVVLGLFVDVDNVFNRHTVLGTTAFVLPHDPDCATPTCSDVPGTVQRLESMDFGRRFQLGIRIAFGGGSGRSFDAVPAERSAGTSPAAEDTQRDPEASPEAAPADERPAVGEATYRLKRRTVVGTIATLDDAGGVIVLDLGLGRLATISFSDMTPVSGGSLGRGRKVRIKLQMEAGGAHRATSIKILD